MKKLVLTGAAGRLGSYLREPLTQMCDELVSTDIVDDIGKLYPGETYMKGDLASLDDMLKVLEGADMVVHMGAYADEGPFEKLLGPNFIGAYNIWEAAYRQGLRRVVYGSSIHAVGMHPKTDFIGVDAPHRPDTFYGLAKCFAEDLGSMYWDKRELESVHMRILSCAQVNNARALGSWLSYDDLIQLVQRSIETPVTGFSVVYGVSNNDRVPVDNAKASFLGYRPKDNAEQFAEQVLADTPPMDNQDPGNMCHGGPFASVELGNSGVASMNIVNDKKET
ncbi:NAD(P)-dependent oxidoreductase [Sulfitobacter mediterraneus]|uniref:NAD-dependent epimerase/dehydratase family protein n=1 Tax=Sulfitobacter mediterraneus TaxID=83219 RepID=UPI00193944AB|nr:NAD(P)-dependent oxidoreductase [Sulfitobacter mediterraneus]MBM1557550.1 NAD(P)-dependent oxidoreductase [Sulfitobacter mediterraneus]MBM1569279.1 NAD(P)-dependent oxidoreductase [Sulfitobacter mediterraneus]MBM1572723.1 NAD(P)-dependent oxidoreductase [Sulfitobacter mediterraneus]MBM1576886.1 NAD(P)-dependent oxidoreductase [Sulfitobacter mediterraneus]MBM1580614.1 NAD(P)-dependent oxidoreductase [Sulfitobacter mediterraneus]